MKIYSNSALDFRCRDQGFGLQIRQIYDIKLIQLGSRPKVRRQILDLLIGVRILSPQPITTVISAQ